MSLPVVKTVFRIGGKEVHSFSSAGEGSQSIYHVAPGAENNRYSSDFTGQHDDGPMPVMRLGGAHEAIIRALQAAKADSDAYLTNIIEQEKTDKIHTETHVKSVKESPTKDAKGGPSPRAPGTKRPRSPKKDDGGVQVEE